MRYRPSIGHAQRAFTLLQLLFSIVLIVTMAALLLPALQGMRQYSGMAGCLNSMRQMSVALFAYRIDVGYFPPGRLNLPGDSLDLKMSNYLVPKYLSKLPYCPLMRLTAAGKKELQGKTEREHFEQIGSYSLNAFLTYTRLEGLPGPYYGSLPYPGDGRMLFLADVYYSGLVWSPEHMKFTLDGADWVSIRVAPRDHGKKRLNFMFLDGHAEAIAPKVIDGNTYDWSGSFDSWGRNGTYIGPRIVPKT